MTPGTRQTEKNEKKRLGKRRKPNKKGKHQPAGKKKIYQSQPH